jgi:hypothetical protein
LEPKKLIMKEWTIISTVTVVALAAGFTLNAQTTLDETLFNENGATYDQLLSTATPISAPGVSVISGFGSSGVPKSGPPFYLSGLGTLQDTVSGAGTYDFIAFVDTDANYADGPFHDSGTSSGSAPSGTSWEIGNNVATGPGSIGYNAANSAPGSDLLSDANDVPGGDKDIAMALGFDFTLTTGETATIDLSLSSSAPGGFYLEDYNDNPNSPDDVFYSGSLSISSNVSSGVPDNGATWISLLLGLMGLAAMLRFERNLFPRKG